MPDFTLQSVGDYFAHSGNSMVLRVEVPTQLEKDWDMVQVLLFTQRKRAVRRGSFHSARFLRELGKLR